MIEIYLVIQESNVDGEILINVTPCLTVGRAKNVMDKAINNILTEHSKFSGLDLDKIEKDQYEKADCDYTLERSNTSFCLNCTCDDYYEYIKIINKELI